SRAEPLRTRAMPSPPALGRSVRPQRRSTPSRSTSWRVNSLVQRHRDRPSSRALSSPRGFPPGGPWISQRQETCCSPTPSSDSATNVPDHFSERWSTMRVPMTEYLFIDLDSERWLCRVCCHDLGDAHGNYKEGTLVYDRDPREIHPSILDPEKYEFTFAPDPAFCRILEF